MRKLTPKQQRFVSEYLIDLNATQAAIRAGYSERTARSIGQRLLTNVDIQEAIRKHRTELEKRTEITIDRCLKEYACIAFLDPLRIFEDDGTLKKIQDIPEEARRAFGGLEVTTLNREDDTTGTLSKVKLLNKKDALDSIMRHLGGFNDKLQIDLPEAVKTLLALLPSEWQDKIKQGLISRHRK